MFSRRIVTLNIEGSSIRVLTLKGRGVEKWGSMPLEPGLVREGLILQPKAVGQAIDALFESMGVSKNKVILSLTGLHSASRILTLPRTKPALMAEAIQREAKREMPVPLEELYLSWRPIGSKDEEQEIFVLGVPRNLVDAEVQTLGESGVKPYIMDLKPLALTRVINRRDALIIDLEPDSFGITLVANGIPAIMRTITPRGEEAILEDNIRRLTEEISRIVEFYNLGHRENPLSPATPAFLTGELSSEAATIELLQAGMEYPIEPLIPPLECPPDFPLASYAVNIGLALKRVPLKVGAEEATTSFRDIDLNILPAKYRARRWPIGYLLFSLAVMIAIGGLFPAYQAKTDGDAETVRLQAELNRVTQELRQVRLAMNQEEGIEDAIDKAVVAAETLEQEHQAILAEGGDFAHILQLVTDALSPGAHFTSIDLTPDQITLKGEADSPSVIISYARTLEALGSFSEVRIDEIRDIKNTEAETTEAESTSYSFTIVISK